VAILTIEVPEDGIDNNSLFVILGAGYAGTDFIEALIRKGSIPRATEILEQQVEEDYPVSSSQQTNRSLGIFGGTEPRKMANTAHDIRRESVVQLEASTLAVWCLALFLAAAACEVTPIAAAKVILAPLPKSAAESYPFTLVIAFSILAASSARLRAFVARARARAHGPNKPIDRYEKGRLGRRRTARRAAALVVLGNRE